MIQSTNDMSVATDLRVHLHRAGPAGAWQVLLERDGAREPLPGLAALVALLERLDVKTPVTPPCGLR